MKNQYCHANYFAITEPFGEHTNNIILQNKIISRAEM